MDSARNAPEFGAGRKSLDHMRVEGRRIGRTAIYKPHQGAREIERRRQQIAKGALKPDAA